VGWQQGKQKVTFLLCWYKQLFLLLSCFPCQYFPFCPPLSIGSLSLSLSSTAKFFPVISVPNNHETSKSISLSFTLFYLTRQPPEFYFICTLKKRFCPLSHFSLSSSFNPSSSVSVYFLYCLANSTRLSSSLLGLAF